MIAKTDFISRRFFLGAASVGAALAGHSFGSAAVADDGDSPGRQDEAYKHKPLPIINVKSYGARGDGKTNDTDAFARAAATICSYGSGTLQIPPGTYIVGKQGAGSATQGGEQVYPASPIIAINGCRGRVLIEGLGKIDYRSDRHDNGRVILRAADGLRFGSFDKSTGVAINPLLPFTDFASRADAYPGLIWLSGNTDVRIVGLELDGNQAGLQLGGFWGDTGRQCAATGILCTGNLKVSIENIYSHHHGLDGVQISNPGLAASDLRPHTLTNVRCEYNARNNLSWVGGSGLQVRQSRFNMAGRGRFHSSPGAGVDIEPEDSNMQGGVFQDCEMVDNVGLGVVSENVVAPASSVSNVQFVRCKIVGTTTYSVLVRNPQFVFDSCTIVGSMTTNPSQTLPPSSIAFRSCTITDIAEQAYAQGLLVDAYYGAGTSFEKCTISSDKQRFGTIGGAIVSQCKFITRLPIGFFPGTDFIVTLYFCSVNDCTFEDLLPDYAGPRLTVNYGANPTFSGNTITPVNARLQFLNAG